MIWRNQQKIKNIWCFVKKYSPIFVFIILAAFIQIFFLYYNIDFDSTAIAQIRFSEKNSVQLHDYDSAYTMVTKNSNGTYTIYLFSAPIQYKVEDGYELIDNTIIISHKEGYEYENKANDVKVYFPDNVANGVLVAKGDEWLSIVPYEAEKFSKAKCKIHINKYGDKVHAVFYERENLKLIFYPTSAGVKCEMIIQDVSIEKENYFFLDSSSSNFENKKNGYISLMKPDGTKSSIIYNSFVSMQNNNIITDIKATVAYEQNKIKVTYKYYDFLDVQGDKSITLDPSFEMYRNKMPDTSVYSNFENNSYLRNYAVVGQDSFFGEGWEYLRIRVNHFFSIDCDSVLSASYNCKKLFTNNKDLNLSLKTVNKDWSSTQMIWSNRVFPVGKITCSVLKDTFSFDITEFLKYTVSDFSGVEEANGLILQGKGGYAILASADNCLYPTYVTITLDRKPLAFVPRENINS